MPSKIVIKLRRDTGTNWTTVNPILANGEAGFDTTTNQIKVGDGANTWANLSYLSAAAGTSLINGNSNVIIDSLNGNLTVGVGGNANILTANANLVFMKGLTANGNSQFNQDVSVSGNLTVVGNLNYFTISNVTVENPIIYVNDAGADDTRDVGLVGQYATGGNTLYTGIARDHNNGTWKVFENVGNKPLTTVDWANASLANFQAGNISALGNITITGNVNASNITANYLYGDGSNLTNVAPGNAIVNGNSNVIVTINDNINVSVAGNANVVTFTDVGLTASALSVTNEANLGNIANVKITGGSNGQYLQTDGNGNLSFNDVNVSKISNGISQINIESANGNIRIDASGTANAIIISSSNVVVAGNIVTSGNVNANIITANLLNGILGANSNSQPNITTIGTLSNLTVNGNVTLANGSVTLGHVSNVRISGGNSGEILSTDGLGNLSWTSPVAQSIDLWTQPSSYSSGKVVRYQGALWSANDIIPANTPFAIGTSGATWAPVDQLTGLNTITTSNFTTSTTLNATTTVDIATALNIPQATSGISLTLPTPTLSNQPRTLFINNTGVTSVLVKGYTLNPGWSVMAIWTGLTWQLAVPDPNTSTWSFLDDSSGVSFSGLSGTAFTQSVSIATTATSNVSAGANGYVTGNLSGTGRYSTVGGGNVIHSGNLSYSGNTTIGTNTTFVVTGNGRMNGGSYANTINTNGTLNYLAANTQILSGVISGVGGVTMNAANQTMFITSNSTYTGNTKVFDGNLSIGNGGATGLLANASNIYVYGNANSRGTLAFRTNYSNTQTISMSSNFFGNGNIFFNGPNVGSNGYYNIDFANYVGFSGNWIVTGARISSNHAPVASKVYVTGSGGQWLITAGNAWLNDWYLNGNGFKEPTAVNGALRIDNSVATTISGNVNLTGSSLIRNLVGAGNVTFTGNLNADNGLADPNLASDLAIYYNTPNTSVAFNLNWANSNNRNNTGLVQGLFNANSVNSFGTMSTLVMGEGSAVILNINANVNVGGISGSQTNANINVVANTTTLRLGGNDSNTTYFGTVSGNGSIYKIGRGTSRFAANASYAGQTTIESGRLIFGNATGTYLPGNGNIVLNVANALANSDVISTVRFDTSAAPAINRTFVGNGNIEFSGTAVTTAGQSQYTLSGSNFANYNGNIVVNQGVKLFSNSTFSNSDTQGIINVASNSSLLLTGIANFYSPITMGGNGVNESGSPLGALQLINGATTTGNITILANTIISSTANTGTVTSNINGNFDVRFSANSGATPLLVLQGQSSNFANTTISGAANGIIRVDNTGAIPNNTVMTILSTNGNVTFNANANISVGSLAGNAGTVLTGANANYTVTTGNLNTTTTYSGVIAGAVNFSKLGNGTLTLDGNSNTTGNFTSSNGAILFGSGGNSGQPGTGFLIVNSPGTITFNRRDTGMNITSGLTGNGNISFLGNGTANTSTYTLASSNATGFTGWINIEANAKLSATSAYGANIQGVNVKANGQLYVSGVANFYNRIDVLGDGWLEANSTRRGALRMSVNSNITSNINLISSNNLADSNVEINLDSTTGNANLLGNINLGVLANGVTAAKVGARYVSNGGELFVRYAGSAYDGWTTIGDGPGTVTLQTSTAIPANSNVRINASTLRVGANLSSGILEGAGNLNIPDNTIMYSFGGANTSTRNSTNTYSGAWTGNGSIQKIGTGNIILIGNSTSTGNLTVTNGNLTIGNSTSAQLPGGSLGATATVIVAGGATLNYIRDSSNATPANLSQRFDGTGDIKLWGTNSLSGNTRYSFISSPANSNFTGNVYAANFTIFIPSTTGIGNAQNYYLSNGSMILMNAANTNIRGNVHVTGIGVPIGANTSFLSTIYFNQANQRITGNVYLNGDTKMSVFSGDTLASIDGVIQNNTAVASANVTIEAAQRLTINAPATYVGSTTLLANALVWANTTNALPVNTAVIMNGSASLTANANITIGNVSGGNNASSINGANASFTVTIGNANNESTYTGNISGNIGVNIIGSNTKLIMNGGDLSTSGIVKITKGILQISANGNPGPDITGASLINVAFGGNLLWLRGSTTASASSRQYTGSGNIIYGNTTNLGAGRGMYSLASWNNSSNFNGNIYVFAANVAVANTVGSNANIIVAANANGTLAFTAGTNNNKIIINSNSSGWVTSSTAVRGAVNISPSAILNGEIVLGDDGNPNAQARITTIAKIYYDTNTGTANINGNITGNGGLHFAGMSGNAHTLRLTGNGTYLGNTILGNNVNVTTLGSGGLNPNTNVTISNTAILTYESNLTIGSLASGNVGSRVNSANANATITIDNNVSNTVFSGQIVGAGKILKSSNCVTTFDGDNTAANIIISNGIVNVSNLSTSGRVINNGGNVHINQPGALVYQRRDSFAASLTVNIAHNFHGNGNVSFTGNSTASQGTYYFINSSNVSNFTGNFNVGMDARLYSGDVFNASIAGIRVESGGQFYPALYSALNTGHVTDATTTTTHNLGANAEYYVEWLIIGGGGAGGYGAQNPGGGGGGGGQVKVGKLITTGTQINWNIGRGGNSVYSTTLLGTGQGGTVSTLQAAGVPAIQALAGPAGAGSTGGVTGHNGGNGGAGGTSSGQGAFGAQGVNVTFSAYGIGSTIQVSGGGSGGSYTGTGTGRASVGWGGGAGGGGGQAGGASTFWGGGGGGPGNNGTGNTNGAGFQGYGYAHWTEIVRLSAPIFLSGTGWRNGTVSSGALFLNTPKVVNSNITLTANSLIRVQAFGFGSGLLFTTYRFTGVISGAFTLTLDCTGGDSSIIQLSGINTISGGIIVTSNSILYATGSAAAPLTLNSGARLMAGTDGSVSSDVTAVYNRGTYSCGALTFNTNSRLHICGSGTNPSVVTATAITASAAWIVDWFTALSAGTYTIIACTGALGTVLPSTGSNATGRTITYAWVLGTGLQATLT